MEKPRSWQHAHIPRVWGLAFWDKTDMLWPAWEKCGPENKSSCFLTISSVLKKPVNSIFWLLDLGAMVWVLYGFPGW